MKKKFDFKLIAKNLLNKINFKITNYILCPFIPIGLIMLLFNYEIIRSLGKLILSVTVLLLLIVFLLFSIKTIIDDIDKVFYALLVLAFFILVFIASTIVVSKIIYLVVPLYYKEGNEEVTSLLFSTYSSVIAAVIGIGGTYFAAIYGGKKSIETTKLQLEQQAKNDEQKKKDDERFALKIISKLLIQEINYNLNILNSINFFSAIETFKVSTPLNGIVCQLKFDVYNNTKYELIKYSSKDSLVENVIDVYGILESLTKYSDANFEVGDDFLRFLELKEKIYTLIESIDTITNNTI